MAAVSVSTLIMVGHQAAKYYRTILAFIGPSLRTGSSLVSSLSMKVVEVDYGRMTSSTIRALSEVRLSRGPLLCLTFNALLTTGVAGLCISGYGLAGGLCIVLLALAPTLMLLNIALFAWIEEEQRPSLLRATSTNTASRLNETLDEKYPSIVPKTVETASLAAAGGPPGLS